MYTFKFTANKIVVMFVIGFLSYNTAGLVTRWLYEHDVFIVLCFIFTLWGFSYAPVWFVDWIIFKLRQWAANAEREEKAKKYGHSYTKFKETRNK